MYLRYARSNISTQYEQHSVATRPRRHDVDRNSKTRSWNQESGDQ
jgi:hypothetical protein